MVETTDSDDTRRPDKGLIWRLGQWFKESESTIEVNGKYGNYVLVRTLGEGGFGITYLAKEQSGKFVVIKTINEKIKADSYFRKFKGDFLQEALELARYNHPHIVKVIEIINVPQIIRDKEQDIPCIVMEYIEGLNVFELVSSQKPLEESEAISYIHQIGNALIEVHHNGVLHRDVKPLNIIIRHDKTGAVLIDFGIARPYKPNERGAMTSFNSEGYTPIEEYESDGNRGYHSDVHALAATLYFMLTGQRPESAEIRTRSKQDRLIPPKNINRAISEGVNKAILKGMERYPEDRPKTIQEWLDLLLSNLNQQESYILNIEESKTTNQQESYIPNIEESKTTNIQKSPNLSPTRWQSLIEATVTGGIYGLLTLPLVNYIFKIWYFIIWLLVMICLIITQFVANSLLSYQNLKYWKIGVGVIALIVGSFEFFKHPLVTGYMVFFSALLSFSLMVVFLSLRSMIR